MIALGQQTYLQLHPDYVVTHLPCGRQAFANRPATVENIAQAHEQGYPASAAGVYASLAEHEALHTLVARRVYSLPNSPVLLQAAGADIPLPYWQRLHEESMVIALQYYLNTQKITPPIAHHLRLLWPATLIKRAMNLCS